MTIEIYDKSAEEADPYQPNIQYNIGKLLLFGFNH